MKSGRSESKIKKVWRGSRGEGFVRGRQMQRISAGEERRRELMLG